MNVHATRTRIIQNARKERETERKRGEGRGSPMLYIFVSGELNSILFASFILSCYGAFQTWYRL